MEAVPRLPMISFDIKTSTEIVSFGTKLKPYILNFYHEDPESYNNEIHALESLRAAAVRPSIDVSGCQLLKKYYCQLHFLKSRFPMEDGQVCSVYFAWRDNYSSLMCSVPDIEFELMNILYDIGAVHSKLGAEDSRVSPEGMKMACTHFQCAAWAFQAVRETYPQAVGLVLAPEVIQFMHITCLAQAQECILEKSMMDNRKATIIAKVAVQVVDYYKQALTTLQSRIEEGSLSDLLGSRIYKEWNKYINFKISYHKAIALLYQGQQAEEQQKMGERVAFYQAASEQLQEACKRANNLSNQQQISEALAFTGDVVEGKKKAAKNENEFIYHEDVPDKDALQEVKGASLVKGIAFSVNDSDVSGPDIFAKLVPMEAHEASSLYSEQKAQLLRQLGELVENKDRGLAEFMSSMKLDILTKMKDCSGVTHDLVDRAAAMSARPTAVQDLVDAMAKLSNTYHDVEAMLKEIDSLLKEEEKKELEYQSQMGKRPPSIIATDLTREYTKYQEAHSKASDSNQTLHRAMTIHIANLKILSQPMSQLRKQIPALELPNSEVDEDIIREIESLIAKVEEMKTQRSILWAQFHDAVKNDDITVRIVTQPQDQNREQFFKKELQKHRQQAVLIEQNLAAQENIKKAIVDAYARFTNTRRYIQDIISKRETTLSALTHSYDTYDDLLSKANKGLDFYNKLETNVTKLLQRIKSTCSVQDEEREQMLAKHNKKKVVPNSVPKLRDYLEPKLNDSNKIDSTIPAVDTINAAAYSLGGVSAVAANLSDQTWPPAVRPTPLGSEVNSDSLATYTNERDHFPPYLTNINQPYYNPTYSSIATTLPNTVTTYTSNSNYDYIQPYIDKNIEANLNERMAALMSNRQVPAMDNREYSQPTLGHSQPTLAHSQPTLGHSQPTLGHSQIMNNTNPEIIPNQNVYNQPPNLFPKQDVGSSNYSNPSSSANLYSYQSNNYIYDTSIQKPLTNPEYTASVPQSVQGPIYSQTNTSYVQPILTSANYLPSNNNVYTHSVSLPNNDPQTLINSYGQFGIPQSSYNVTNSHMQSVSIPNSYVQANSNIYTQSTQVLTQPNQAQEGYSNPNVYSTNQAYMYNNSVASNLNSVTYPAENYGIQQYYNPYAVQTQDTNINYVTPTNSTTNMTMEYINYPTSEVVNQGVTVNTNVTPFYTPAEQVVKEKSNIDLLTGLDFSINQAPLIPQSNKIETIIKDTISAKTVEPPIIHPSKSNIIKSEEKPNDTHDILIKEKKYSEIKFQRNTFQDPETLKQFGQELDKFEKFVDAITTKTLNGPTLLDVKWKEIQDKQEIEQQKKSISVARCYPMKNRFPDILPYDQTRVKLTTIKDDYINASYIKDITPHSPTFIVTQSPIQSTYNEFWTMVYEQQVEIILCLLNDNEIGQDIYWPKGNQSFIVGNISISVQNINAKEYWTVTLLNVNQLEQRCSRTVRHVQFTGWPSSLFPTSPVVVNYINEIIKDQKELTQPILIHCLSGIGRSGLLCLLIAAASEVLVNPTTLPDLLNISIKLSNTRKNIIRDREHFKFAYYVFLNFLKELYKTYVSGKQSLNDISKLPSQPVTILDNPIDDPLNMLDPLWATRKSM